MLAEENFFRKFFCFFLCMVKAVGVGGKVMIKGAVVGFLSLQNNFNKIQN
ncbi:hypothetical protein B4064_1834 [Caldibacillus thermoamylovorans]|nr:hypothetical protein B4064_1834 [Caldibacillus thermoamylovorans]